MATLHEQEAVEYLTRARSCLHPEVDNFASIPLIAKMLDVEVAFIRRAVAKRANTIATIPMEATGLPELTNWQQDIVMAFEEIPIIRKDRAHALDDYVQELTNASERGMEIKSEGFLKTIEEDHALLEELDKLSFDQVEFLTGDWKNSKFPIYQDQNWPGLLFSRTDRSPFMERRGVRKMFEGSGFSPGLKYVDAKNEGKSLYRAPYIMMFFLSQGKENMQGFRVITPGASLIQRSYTQSRIIQFENSSATTEYVDLSLPKEPDEYKFPDWKYSSDRQTAKSVEGNLHSLHPSIFRALHQTEYVGKSDSVLEGFFQGLTRANSLIDKAVELSQKTLNVETLNPDQVRETLDYLRVETQQIYNSILDDDLRRAMQIAVAQEMKDVRDKTDTAKAGLDIPETRSILKDPGRGKRESLWGIFRRKIK